MVLGTSAGWTGHLAKAVHQAKVDHQGQGSHLTRLHIWKWSEMHNGIFPDLYLTSPSSSETKLILRFFLRPELFLRSENFSWDQKTFCWDQKVFPGTRNFSLGPEIFPRDQKFFLGPENNPSQSVEHSHCLLENIQLRMFSWAAVENVQNVWWECSAETVETAWGECSSELQPVALNLILAFFRACSCNVHLGPGCASWGLCKKPFSARLSSLNETSHPLCVQKHSLNTLLEGY